MGLAAPSAAVLAVLSASMSVHAATLVRLDSHAMESLHSDTSIAIGSDGMPRVVHQHSDDGTFWFTTCAAPDCSTSVSVVTGAIGISGSMVLDADDGMRLAYYDFVDNALVLDDGTRHMLDAAGDVGLYASLVLDHTGRPVVAYEDLSNDSLRLAACLDSSCTSVSIVTLDDDPAVFVGEHVDLAIGVDGLPIMSYVVLPNGYLRVAKCLDATCTSRVTHDLDQPSVGRFTSIAIGADGNPIISYYDFGRQALKAAKCTDADCAQPAIVSTLDDRDTGTGWYTAIAIRPDGNPVISYRRRLPGGGDYALAVAECHTADCAGAVALLTIDARPGEIVGDNTDIAIGADGAAVISYYSQTTDSVYFAKCSVQTCAATGDGVFISGFEG